MPSRQPPDVAQAVLYSRAVRVRKLYQRAAQPAGGERNRATPDGHGAIAHRYHIGTVARWNNSLFRLPLDDKRYRQCSAGSRFQFGIEDNIAMFVFTERRRIAFALVGEQAEWRGVVAAVGLGAHLCQLFKFIGGVGILV